MTGWSKRTDHSPSVDIFSICARPDLVESCQARVVLYLENYHHIAQAYGPGVARHALDELCSRLRIALLPGAEMSIGHDTIGMVFNLLAEGGGEGDNCSLWLPELCQALTALPIETPAGPLHGWVACSWCALEEEWQERDSYSHAFVGPPVGRASSWAAQYRADMATVAAVLPRISGDAGRFDALGISLAWQGVHDGRDPLAVLYREVVPRIMDGDGSGRPFTQTVLAFERLGFAPLLDAFIIERVLDELEAAPHIVLGVKLSGQSARTDNWWSQAGRRIIGQPSVASRLILEITSSQPLVDINEAVRFVDLARKAGCGVAVAGFGTGHASLRQVLALAPDIVRIDRLFLAPGVIPGDAIAILQQLTGLSQGMGAIVVLDGVDSQAGAQAADAVGARWQQGAYYGQPSWARPWRFMPGRHAASPPTGLGFREDLFTAEKSKQACAPRGAFIRQGDCSDAG